VEADTGAPVARLQLRARNGRPLGWRDTRVEKVARDSAHAGRPAEPARGRSRAAQIEPWTRSPAAKSGLT
jgi:hypothetical protein